MPQWTVELAKDAAKAVEKLGKGLRQRLIALIRELEVAGPVRGELAELWKAEAESASLPLEKGAAYLCERMDGG